MAVFGIDCHSAVVPYVFFCTAYDIEERRFPTVGISYKGYVYMMSLCMECIKRMLVFFLPGVFDCLVSYDGGLLVIYMYYFNKSRFRCPQGHFVAHYAIFYGILKWRMQNYKYGMPLDEAHFHNSFTEGSMPVDFNYNTGLPRFEVCQFHNMIF